MLKKASLTIFPLLFCITVTNCLIDSTSKSQTIEKNLQMEVLNAEDVTITMQDIALFLETKKEHYPLSDEFIERYQQTSGGYIANAKKAGLLVDKYKHEPNQKWHFFDSWLYPSIEAGTLTWEETAKSRVYSKLLCPELLLWIYEACEVDINKVRNAKLVAEEGKATPNTSVSTIAKNMRECVSWEDIEKTLINFKNNSSKSFSVFINSGEGFSVNGLQNEYKVGSEVSFTVDVTDSTKTIEEVKINDKILEPFNESTYKFTMPANEVTIYVTLKDKKAATSVVLNTNIIELNAGESQTINATVEPLDTTDIASWSVIEGEDLISITPNGNNVIVKAIKKGTAKIKVAYNENVNAECLITINEQVIVPSEGSIANYNIKFDMQGGVKSKEIKDAETLLNVFEFDGEGTNIITSISQFEYMYGGAYGTSDGGWSAGDVLKFGTTSVNGSLTLSLNTEVNRVKITGYVSNVSCKIQIGDSDSTDWTEDTDDNKTTIFTCSDMKVTNKEVVEGKQTSTVMIDFASTKNLKIATTNKKPFYITSIEFIYNN